MSKSSSTRQLVVNIEATGIDPADGHRVIELAVVELIDRRITGAAHHYYINPERNIDPGAEAVHALSREFLQNKPKFREIAQELIDFVRGADLLAHNVPYHVGFLNAELGQLDLEYLDDICPKIIDILESAKTIRPEQSNSINALCADYGIDYSDSDLSGATLDAHLIAQIYLVISHQLLH